MSSEFAALTARAECWGSQFVAFDVDYANALFRDLLAYATEVEQERDAAIASAQAAYELMEQQPLLLGRSCLRCQHGTVVLACNTCGQKYATPLATETTP